MSNDSVAAATTVLLVVSLVWIVIGIGLLVWYLWAMARLFPRIGLRAGEGWIPIWNQWKLLDRAGLPGWLVLFTFIGLGIIPFIMQIIAMHRLGREYGASAGYTVIGVILPPLWATLFASYIGTGHASHHAGASAPASPQYALAQGVPAGYAGSYAPVPASAPPAAPVPPPPPAYTEPGHTAVPELPPESMPEPWPSAVWANVPAQDTPLGAETEAEYDRLAAESFQAPPAVPLGQQAPPSPFSWTAASQSNPEPAPAEPEPVIPPVHPFAVNQAAEQPNTPPAAPQQPVAPPVAQPPAAPQQPVAPPVAPPPAAQQPVAPPVQPVQLPPTPASATSAARPTGITGVYERLPEADRARAAHAEEPAQLDLDRTIVVPRRPAVTWSLELPDGSRLPLDDDTIVGRRPVEFDGAAVVAIPDPTRTLSKSHARLTRDGDQWFVEDLGSTNGLVLINDDGSESEIPAGVRVAATERMLFGTLEVRLRSGGDAA